MSNKNKKKRKSVIVEMRSTGILSNGKKSSYRKTCRKNPRMENGINGKGKLTGKRMFDPFTRKHEKFEEKKVSK
jgi:hypothetical protein